MKTDEEPKKRQSVVDAGQRNQLEAVQNEIRRNNDTLTSLRRENKELRRALQQSLRGQTNVSIEDHYAKEEEMLHNKMCVLKRSLNAVKGKNTELAKEIEKTKEDNAAVLNEGSGAAVNENSVVAKKIRALENRLDKCLIKHNEVNAIRRTYETLLERLQLEQSGFDTQLSSTEKALLSAERELTELNEVGQQASKGRDQARAEVSRLKAKLVEDRRSQAKDLDQRREFIQEKRNVLERKHNILLVKMAQQEERHAKAMQAVMGGGGTSSNRRRMQDTDRGASGNYNATNSGGNGASWLATLTPEELEELHRQKEVYLKLRDATMSTSVAEVIAKVGERRENNEQLIKTSAELEQTVSGSRETLKKMQAAWEEMNQKAGGAMVSAKATRTARDKNLLKGGGNATDSDDDDDDNAANNAASGGGRSMEPDYGLLASRVRQNRAVIAEFAGHLKDREAQVEEAQQQQDTLSQLITDVEAGVRHLSEKLSVRRSNNTDTLSSSTPVAAAGGVQGAATGAGTNFAALLRTKELGEAAIISAVEAVDLLRSCDAKMQVMLDELTLEEVNAVARAMNTASVIVPSTNVRLNLPNSSGDPNDADDRVGTGGGGGTSALATDGAGGRDTAAEDGQGDFLATTAIQFDDFPDSELHDRTELKMMSLATVEREETKRMRKRAAAASRKDEST